MVKAHGVTLVALATLLAGFVASCSSGDAPSIEDIPPSGPAVSIETRADDNDAGTAS